MTQPTLAVFFEAMPESNGKRNWTVAIHRHDENIFHAITVSRGEYYDRARYEADSWRYMLGMIPEKPNLLEYDPDLLCPEDHPLANFDGTFPDANVTLEEIQAGEAFWRDDHSPSDLDMIPVDAGRCDARGMCHEREFPPAGCESPDICTSANCCMRY